MASYKQYIPTHYNEYVPNISADEFKQGLQMKQQQYDAGRKLINDSLDEMFNIDLIKESDREYLKAKQNEITSIINKSSNLDFSKQNNVQSLIGQIQPLYQDKRILKSVESTYKVRAFQEAQKKLMETHPDRYSPFNQMVDNKQVQDYLADPNPDRVYDGPVTPTLFTDYKKNIVELGKKLKPDVYTDPKTGMQITGVSPRRIRGLIDPASMQQIQMEFEYSGAKATDPMKARNDYVVMLGKLDEALKNADKTDPEYPKYFQLRQHVAEVIAVKNDDAFLEAYNQDALNREVDELIESAVYEERVISPEALENLRDQSRQAVARINANKTTTTIKADGTTTITGAKPPKEVGRSSVALTLDDIATKAKEQFDANPNSNSFKSTNFPSVIIKSTGGTVWEIIEIEAHRDGTFSYTYKGRGKDQDMSQSTMDKTTITNVSREALEDIVDTANKRPKHTYTPPNTPPNTEDDKEIDPDSALEGI